MNNLTKYPRTFHLPWSQGRSDDDKVLKNVNHLVGKEVVITKKLDGENTSLYPDGYMHARSIDGNHHLSRNWVKRWWSERCESLPTGWRVCGENVFAEHSISYTDLESYFYGFSIWNEDNVRLSWDETLEWFELLEIVPVKTLWRGQYNDSLVKRLAHQLDLERAEGFVVALAERFNFDNFETSVAKFVRSQHVQTDAHWAHQVIKQNKLRGT